MDDWLLQRLSPVKDSDPRWTGLAVALQRFWERNFDAMDASLRNLRSIYTMSAADLALKMREKGDYFSPDWPTEYDQPLAVAWREGEILRKSTEYIITSTFRRNFLGLKVEWVPLYAKKSDAYGSFFVPKKVAYPEVDYWLTSRGKVSIDIESMARGSGWTIEDLRPIVDRVVRKLKPLHIVYEGVFLSRDIYFYPDIQPGASGQKTVANILIDASPWRRYDIAYADVAVTDTDTEGQIDIETASKAEIAFCLGIVALGPLFDEIALDEACLDLNPR